MDRITKRRIDKILIELRGQEFTSHDIVSMLPHDIHLPTNLEVAKYIMKWTVSTGQTVYPDNSTKRGKVVVWTVD